MPAISFTQLAYRSFWAMKGVARQQVQETTLNHHENWKNRFGNEFLIGDDSGVPGTAPALSKETIERKGHDLMLVDETKVNDEYPIQLVDSLYHEFAEGGDGAEYFAIGGSYINNPVFANNEFGRDAPTRTTLLPTRAEISDEFEENLRAAYLAVRVNVRGDGGTYYRLWRPVASKPKVRTPKVRIRK